MSRKMSDPVALDIIADLLSSESNWADNWQFLLQEIADTLKATGREVNTTGNDKNG